MSPADEHVEPWLDAYRTGDLEPARAREVERHVSACADCGARLREIEALAATAARGFAVQRALLARSEPDWERQRARILARIGGGGTAASTRGAPSLPRYASRLAAAAVAVIVAGVLLREGVRGPADAERLLKKAPPAAADEPPQLEPGAPAAAPGERAPRPSGGRLEQREIGESQPPARAEEERRDDAGGADQSRDAGAPPVEPLAPVPPGSAATGPEGEETDRAAAAAAGRPPAAFDTARPRAAAHEPAAGAAAAAGETTAPAPARPAGADVLQRLDLLARHALATRDSLDAAVALAFWRDSVAGLPDLDPDRKLAAAALADSLAAAVPGAAAAAGDLPE